MPRGVLPPVEPVPLTPLPITLTPTIYLYDHHQLPAQLDSEEAGDREMACSTLAQSFQDAGGVGEAEVGALPSLAARLLPILQSDASLAVHVEACAALR